MNQPPTTRRSMLSYLTGGGVAVGALVAGGAVLRSCAPAAQRITRIDLSDMAEGEARGYFGKIPMIIVRNGGTLAAFDARCPVSSGWVLSPYSLDNTVFCAHCTSRFSYDGQIVKFWSNPSPPPDAPNLTPASLASEGLILLIGEDEPVPELLWFTL